ncbi:DNA repair protein RecN [Corynebacterium macginleyi]|uniref:DNA repair protein RecN n=1 Tax=Corynebacterium macginleyi TaxID=38290 RepID=UPI00190E1C67|nr:DNA repair protein RecN [Corynebacterium macginleyi]
MLVDISINDLGVIRHSSAELSEGLTVLTGETGAGKTMVVTGLRLLAGGRADASRVRDGAKKAVVEGHFSSTKESISQLVDSVGGEPDENGEFIVSRTVSAAGRSRAYLGGRAVPAATLGDFAREIITVHGQNDQLRLLAPEEQLGAVDRADPRLAGIREDYAEAFQKWRSLAKDYRRRTESRRELAQEADRLQYALEEIDGVAPEPGEDAKLVQLVQRLQDVDGLRESAHTALAAIDGTEELDEAASSLLGRAGSALGGSPDNRLSDLGERIFEITSQLGDISAELGGYLAGLPADPTLLEKSLQRQQALRALTRKYASDIDGVLAWRDEAESKLQSMDTSAEVLEELKVQVKEAEEEMMRKAAELTKGRRKAAQVLGKLVTEELHGLAMPNSTLTVKLSTAKYSKTGADSAELQLNGKQLATVASGGELSRVMLALEVVLASEDGATLVFDEVDAGVGGRAAVEIGRRLARLAAHNQVIVVTHLPQVAAYADAHLHVSKDKFTSGVAELSEQERVEELARMLAGLDDTDTGRAHAQELFDRAQKEASARLTQVAD